MVGIVLAGGKSRRMGQEKALLAYQGTTLLEHVVETVRAVTGEVLVVAEVAHRYALPYNVSVIGDLYPEAGPLGGIVTGLTVAETGYHLIVGCDMPHLQPALLRLLLQQAEGGDGAVPVVGSHLEPLCAVYHSRCLAPLRAALEAGRFAAHQAIETLNLRRVAESELRAVDPDLLSFTNINTPEDYRRLS